MKTNDISSINTIKQTVITNRYRKNNPEYFQEFPFFIGLKITNKCNLRCTHCYQWSETGHHNFLSKHEQKAELPFDILLKVFHDSKPYKSRLYIWGGEPLLHSHFREAAEYLKTDKRDLVICTNGTLLDKYLDCFDGIAESVDFLIPIEGFEDHHNKIRGNNYQLVLRNLEKLLYLKKHSKTKIKISIHTVITKDNVSDLYELFLFFNSMDIDLFMPCIPWYISEKTCRTMDSYYKENLSWIGQYDENKLRSWYGYAFNLEPEYSDIFMQQYKKICNHKTNMTIMLLPNIENVDLLNYLKDNYSDMYCGRKCLGVSNRVDITPTGDVSACKHFSEFTMGNLLQDSLYDIWKSENYKRFRKELNNSIMPVCPKCNVLHVNSIL